METALRAYEVMVILDPNLDERTVEPSLDKYLNVIRKDGGSVDKVDVWGRRRLAYEIKKNAEGIYAVISLQAEPATVKEFDRQLTLNESVLRTKVHPPRRSLTRTASQAAVDSRFPHVGGLGHDDTVVPTLETIRRPDMAGETIITVVGNLVDDPELRFTPSGAAVANFRIASTPRTFDRQTNEWKDGDALFLSCSVWRQAAENVAESLQRGMRVVVQGRLKSRQYETREGEKRTVFEIEVEEVGPSLKYATAKVTRTSPSAAVAAATPVAARAAASRRATTRGPRRLPRPAAPAAASSAGAQPVAAPRRRPRSDPWGAPGSARTSPPSDPPAPSIRMHLNHSGAVATLRRASRKEAPQWPRQ